MKAREWLSTLRREVGAGEDDVGPREEGKKRAAMVAKSGGYGPCVWNRIGQMARHSTPRRSGIGGSSDSSQRCG